MYKLDLIVFFLESPHCFNGADRIDFGCLCLFHKFYVRMPVFFWTNLNIRYVGIFMTNNMSIVSINEMYVLTVKFDYRIFLFQKIRSIECVL